MRLNVENMKDVLFKATCNYSLDSVGLTITPDKITSGSKSNNIVIVLNLPNNVIPDIPDTTEMYFSEPNQQVKVYLDLMSGLDDVQVSLSDTKMTLTADGQKGIVHYCSANLVPTFSGDGPKVNGVSVYNTQLDDNWVYKFEKIRGIASRFQKIYFTIKDKTIYMESTDKSNQHSNGISFNMGYSDHVDLCLGFDYKVFSNVMKVIGDRHDDFTVTLDSIKTAGLLSFINADNTEKYFLISQTEV